jgi:hypothetical protein
MGISDAAERRRRAALQVPTTEPAGGRAPWRQRLRNGSSRAGPDRKEPSVCPDAADLETAKRGPSGSLGET